jgi:hypothetical protein
MGSDKMRSQPVSNIIGPELAADFELLLRMSRDASCIVTGPNLEIRRKEVYSKACALAGKHKDTEYLLVVHESFGALVIAPVEMLAGHGNFAIRARYNASG